MQKEILMADKTKEMEFPESTYYKVRNLLDEGDTWTRVGMLDDRVEHVVNKTVELTKFALGEETTAPKLKDTSEEMEWLTSDCKNSVEVFFCGFIYAKHVAAVNQFKMMQSLTNILDIFK